MKTGKPLVSVIMPVHNAKQYLRESIESILDQTYNNFEFLIADDGSNDGSTEIIDEYSKKDSRVKVYKYEKPHGFGGEVVTNLVIKKCKGKYVAKMDADDVSVGDRLEKQVNYLENNDDIFLVGGQAYIINSEGKVVGERNQPCGAEKIRKTFFLKNCISHPTAMYRNLKGEEEFYRMEFKYHNDYNTWLYFLSIGFVFENLPDYLLCYRVHGKNETYTNLKNKFRENVLIKMKYKSKLPVSLVHYLIVKLETVLVLLFPERVCIRLYKQFHLINKIFSY